MTLVTPKAGLTAGRSADIRVADTGGAADDAVARFGDRIAQVGARLEADRLDREASRAQIDMTRELGRARQEFEQMSDPDAIDRGWPERVNQLRAQLLDGQTEDGRPRVDPKIRDRVGLAFDDLAVKHGLALGRVSIAARRTQRQADWMEYSAEVVNQGATVDAETRAVLLDQAEERISADLRAGMIDPVEAARRRKLIRGQADGAAAITMIANDPAGFLDAVEQGQFAGIDAGALARLKVQAKSNIDRQAAAEAKAAEAASKERQRQIGDRLGELIDIFGAGRTAVDEAFLNDPEVKSHPKYAQAMAAMQLRNEQASLPFLPVSKLDDLIAAEEQRPITRKWQTERLDVLRKLRADAAKGWTTDPVAYAGKIGLPVPPVPDPAAATPQELGMALAKRLGLSDFLVEQGYIDKPAYLSREETAALRAATDKSVEPGRRAEIANILARTLGGRDPEALARISGDPVFAHVAGLTTDGGGLALATEVFRGQQVLDAKGIVMPKLKDRIGATFDEVGAIFAGLPGGTAIQAQIVAAADALYAARQSMIDPSGRDLDKDLYQQALHEVMGGTGTYGSSEARGGIQDVGGALVVLPAGVSGKQVEALHDDLKILLQGGDPGSSWFKRLFAQTDKSRQELAISLLQQAAGGQRPLVHGDPLDSDTFSRLHLQAIGDDRYRLVYPAKSGNYFLEDETGKTFTFSLRDLLQRVSP